MHSVAISTEDRQHLLARKRTILSHEGVAEGGHGEVQAAWRELEQVERALERLDAAAIKPAKSAPAHGTKRKS